MTLPRSLKIEYIFPISSAKLYVPSAALCPEDSKILEGMEEPSGSNPGRTRVKNWNRRRIGLKRKIFVH
jgi:hypothetical protein